MSRQDKRGGRRGQQLRAQLAGEAARLMYHEGVKQYLDAKQIAARRLLGSAGARRIRFRPHDLPSNGEIRAALLQLAEQAEGPARAGRLLAMRAVALEVMAALEGFSPRLIGSVASGHIRCGSDIDLHVFADEDGAITARLASMGWPHETERIAIRKGGVIAVYTHVYLDRGFPVELSVYPRRELRVVGRSSTDGQPIDRVSPGRLAARARADAPELWRRYQDSGEIPDLDAHVATSKAGPAGAFDGLLATLSDL